MKSLNPIQGGSDSRNLETTGRLQILQHVRALSTTDGTVNSANEGTPQYVGITSQESVSVGEKVVVKRKKNGDGEIEKNLEKEKKKSSRAEDGILLVVPARIHGKEGKTLIDSGELDVLSLHPV